VGVTASDSSRVSRTSKASRSPALEEHNTAANHQSGQYKNDVQKLRDNPKIMVLVLDFTKFHQVRML